MIYKGKGKAKLVVYLTISTRLKGQVWQEDFDPLNGLYSLQWPQKGEKSMIYMVKGGRGSIKLAVYLTISTRLEGQVGFYP